MPTALSLLTRVLLAFQLVLLTACTGGGDGGNPAGPPPPPPGPTTGGLTVTITGLPSGTPADVLVTGPGGFSRTLAESGTMSSLTPGRYAVAARVARGSAGAFVPRVGSVDVDVAASATPAAATVTYDAASAALVLTVAGVPAGATPRITVSRPGASDTLLGAGATLTAPAGRWRVTADSVRVAPLTYRATPSGADTALRGGDTLRFTAQYRPQMGSLRLTAAGLPAGVTASGILSGAGLTRTVTIPSRIDSLPPAAYTVVSGAFVANTIRYTPQALSASASVAVGDTATAAFTFTATPTVLGVAISGLPGGTDAAVVLTPPAGSPPATPVTVTASSRLIALAAGSWSWRADTVTTPTARFAATPRTGTVTVVAGDSVALGVAYAQVTGALAVAVTGLPAGAEGAVTVSGPGGFAQALTATTTLTRLVPGGYTVTAAGVTRGGTVYTPQPAAQTVAVSASPTAAAATVAYATAPPGISALAVSPAPLSLTTGATRQLVPAPTQPAGAPAATYNYTTSNAAVATVSAAGVVTGVAAGTATITVTGTTAATATFSAGSAVATVAVSVSELPPGITAVSASPASSTLFTGGTRQLVPLPTQPAGAPAATYGYSSSATAVATVTASGLITAVAPGSATITITASTAATTGFAAASVAGTVAITVSAPVPGISAVSVTPVSLSIGVGSSRALTPTPTQPAGAPTPSYSYATSAPGVATVSSGGVVTAVAQGSATITVTASTAAATGFTAASVTAQVPVTVTPPVANFQISNAYVVQAVQTPERSAGLVSGRAGLLRVFVTSTLANSATPPVRVSVYHGATLVRTATVTAPEASVRTAIAPEVLTSTWNLSLTAGEVVAGLRILAELDPANTLAEADRSDNSWPASGTPHSFTVATVPAFTVRFIPVTVGSNTGNVTAGNAASFTDLAQRLFPMPSVSSSIRAPFTSSVTTLEADSLGKWNTILSEVQALRATDGAAAGTYYYGVLKVTYNAGYAGLAYTPGRTGIGWDYAGSAPSVAAHEWGHNFGRFHAPCDVDGEDGYPYAGGVIGQYGWNPFTNAVVLPTATDIMGYCSNQWVSDYTWNAVLQHRGGSALQALRASAREPGVLVWGRIEGGRVVLEPAFQVTAPATAPAPGGTLRVELLDAAGVPLAAQAVQPLTVDHAPAQHFAVVVPLGAAAAGRLAGVRVRDVRVPTRSALRMAAAPAAGATESDSATATIEGERTRVRWRGRTVTMAMVRDAASGEVLGFVRTPGGTVRTDGRAVEVVYSDGVRSRVKRPF